MNKRKLSPEEEAVYLEIIKDGEKLMQEMEDFIEILKRRNLKYMGITIGIIIGFFLWMFFIFGWVIR